MIPDSIPSRFLDLHVSHFTFALRRCGNLDILRALRWANLERFAKVCTSAAVVLAFGALLTGGARAFDTMTVSVSVDSANAFNACWDPWCGKPDLFVVFYGTGTSAQSPVCKSATVIDRMNVGNPAPADWSCNHFVVKRPGKVYIGLYDGDGPNQDNTQGEQLDISPGDEKSAAIDLENVARNQGAPVSFQSRGDDAKISFKGNSANERCAGFRGNRPSRLERERQKMYVGFLFGIFPFVKLGIGSGAYPLIYR
jgi:hypothetical protein